MAEGTAYGPVAEARTRAVSIVLGEKTLLEKFLEAGGLETDLLAVKNAGGKAFAAHTGQSVSAGEGKGATADVALRFEQLQFEYRGVMSVVRAIQGEARRTGAGPALLAAVDQIIKNEVPVNVVEWELDGTKKRSTRPSRTLEDIRAEIEKDARALRELDEIHPALERRRVPLARLKKLESDAQSLSGLLGKRAARKGAAKAATAAERAAVSEQKAAWGACYRLLARVARNDQRLRQLLKEAAG